MKKSGNFQLGGVFEVVHRGVDGREKSRETIHNLVVNEGINYALDAMVNGGTQISAWYFAPWSTNTAPAATHTYAAPTNTETTAYSESTRQEWAAGAASGQAVTNATAATITANDSVTIYGVGIVGGGTGATTKGDTAGGGKMLSSAMFSTSKSLTAGETLDITYTLNGSSS